LDCWYVVATGDEVTHALACWGRPFCCTASARVLRCAHRSLPLSVGQLVDDRVVCRYHGFTYDGSGACVHVPSLENVPYGAKVRSFLVSEQGPYVWVWVGNTARGRATAPPSLPWLAEDGWTSFDGALDVAGNYMLQHENALDRTHFAFVHADTSPTSYLKSPPPMQVEVTETSVSYARSFPAAPLATWQVAATGLSADGHYEQHESGVFVSPALHVDHMQVVDDRGRAYQSVFTYERSRRGTPSARLCSGLCRGTSGWMTRRWPRRSVACTSARWWRTSNSSRPSRRSSTGTVPSRAPAPRPTWPRSGRTRS